MLGIDDYQIEVSALQQHAALQAQPVAKAAAVAAAAALQPPPKKNPPRPSPTKSGTAWWKNLRRMRRPPSRRRRSPIQQPPAAGHPARELNPADPLAQLAGDVDLRQLQQQQTDPAALFNTDTTFEREHILADTTPARCWRNRLRQRGRQLRLRMRGNRSKSWIRWRCSAVHPLPRRPKR